MEDLIDFEVIENQKENIQSLPGGRSARALANLYSPLMPNPTPSHTRDLNDAARQEYETELENISESDDPLDIYDRYVRWTLDAYPSAQATPQSQLLPLLERATKTFLTSSQYKDDPRYLKLWLQYIRFFSDAPRETFAFLARHRIGESLALFYEEFAAWLEGAGRWAQAEEVYKLGMDKEARPTARLLRKFNEFQERFAQRPDDHNEPSSPALPTVRPALAAKIDPFAAAASDPQAPRPSAGVGSSSKTKSGRQKLAIFSDADEAVPAVAPDATKGWDSIGSLAERKKENMMEPKPWAGETLKAGGKKSSTKMAVFKDVIPNPQLISPSKEQITVNPRTGRNERIYVNLEAVYPNPDAIGTELSFEELRAEHRGWLSKVWASEKSQTIRDSTSSLQEPMEVTENSIEPRSRDIPEKLVIPRDPVDFDENGTAKEKSREGRNRKMRVKEVNETQIIRTKLSSPSGPKIKKRKASKEQTMTLHTRAATDEIYDLFNQPLKSADEEPEEDEDEEEDDEEEESDDDDGDETDGDYTSGAESTTTGHLCATSEAGDDETGTSHIPTTSEAGDETGTSQFPVDSEAGDDETSDVKSVSEWSEFTARKHIPDIDDEENDTRASHLTADEEHEEFEALEVKLPDVNSEENGDEELATPVSPNLPATSRTMFVPIPPEDYVPPVGPYRDPSQVSQNRLPFMTPIAEKTESSLGMPTVREDKNYFHSKTPSKAKPPVRPTTDPELMSSPFSEIVNDSKPMERIAQPLLTKNPKASKPAPLAVRTQSTSAPLAKEIAPKGPIINDTQCNPVDDYVRATIFENLQPPLSTYEGFFEHKDVVRNGGPEIKKFAKAMSKLSKNSSEKTATNITMPPTLRFPGVDRQYTVKRELGAGAFAPVYLLENTVDDADEDKENAGVVMGKGAFDHFGRKKLEALKMEDPPTAWEFYIMRQARRRLGVSRAAESVINVYEMHLYKDECYLIEEFREQGTLLDIINLARAEPPVAGGVGVMDEALVMFFTIELFRTIEAIHSKGILHGDLKADNCLVRFDSIPDEAVWSTRFHRDGTSGWNKKGIALIDFGRGIDMKVFRPEVQFIADWKTTAQDCAEMRELRPWTYQIDYHGLAGIIHSMLFGKYIDTMVAKDTETKLGAGATKTWRIKESLKRYWQTDIWNGVFDLLLNPLQHLEAEEGKKLPVLKSMKSVREGMEEWLEANSERGIGLQAVIRKLEHGIQQRRK
ncbi:hypothetical protein BP6252_02716 [Coleophoma cylindrospora]|uniref:Uncharacterized protein n=1 Tax=Coleophoma cylindrospora TaxID=1849047 RepID=A0A3D8SFS1_9HELO|nr:hypothetical protein BP6252_02716 [Coleophoma cylindrospora]